MECSVFFKLDFSNRTSGAMSFSKFSNIANLSQIMNSFPDVYMFGCCLVLRNNRMYKIQQCPKCHYWTVQWKWEMYIHWLQMRKWTVYGHITVVGSSYHVLTHTTSFFIYYDGIVVRMLGSHQEGPGLNPQPDGDKMGLSS